LLGSLFEEYPPTARRVNQPQRISRNDAMNTVNDQGNQPCEQREYLHLLGILNYISHTRLDISTALSYAAAKNKNATKANFDELLLVVLKNKEFIYRYLSKAEAIVTSRSRVLGFGQAT
jgi:hypothetical protein